ncbi:MAG: ABC transporter ATP-binding protein, partial [Tistlia sp.]
MYFDPRLWPFTQGLRGRIAAAVGVGLVSSLIGVARLALLGWLLGRILGGATLAELWLPALGVAGVILLRGLVEYLRIDIAHETAARVQLVLRERLYDRIVALGPAWFGLNRSGDVITSLIEGVEQLEVYFGKYLPQLLVALLTPVAIFGFVAFLDLPVAALLLFFALATLLAPAVFHRWDARNSLARAQAYRSYAAEFLDSVQGLATLKSFGQSRSRAAFLADKAREIFRRTMWVLATNSATRGIADTGIALGAVSALALGSWRVLEGEMSLTALLVVLLLGVEVFRPLRDLRGLLHDAMLARSAASGILELLDSRPAIENPGTDPGPLEPSLAFEGVRFSYPGGRAPAHQGLSFAVRAGERVGIVGASGSGKSSILRLLLRFYDPQEGRVLLGGRDLRTLGFEALRRHYAIVGQDTYLFHGTVEENLRLGDPQASRERLEAAAEAAKAHDFIRALPQGYDTVIGERGIRLSGGQRQRIAIARALLRDAPILLLDEALSAVDADNEAAIQEALDRLMAGRTTLVLAHRLSSVIGCDRILVMDQGRVVEAGSHAELVARRGAYWRLMAEQLQGGEAEEAAELLP